MTKGGQFKNILLRSGVLWLVLSGVLVVPTVILSGRASSTLGAAYCGILAILLIVSRNRWKDGFRSTASSIAMAVLSIISSKHGLKTNMVVCGVSSVIFGVFAISEIISQKRSRAVEGPGSETS